MSLNYSLLEVHPLSLKLSANFTLLACGQLWFNTEVIFRCCNIDIFLIAIKSNFDLLFFSRIEIFYLQTENDNIYFHGNKENINLLIFKNEWRNILKKEYFSDIFIFVLLKNYIFGKLIGIYNELLQHHYNNHIII